jgi:hypothetical protein
MAPEEDTNSKIIAFEATNITLHSSREIREQNTGNRQGRTLEPHAVARATVQ